MLFKNQDNNVLALKSKIEPDISMESKIGMIITPENQKKVEKAVSQFNEMHDLSKFISQGFLNSLISRFLFVLLNSFFKKQRFFFMSTTTTNRTTNKTCCIVH